MKFIKTVVIVVLLTQSFDMMGLDVKVELGKVDIVNKIRELFRGKTNVVFRGKLLPTDRLKQPLVNIDLDIISVPEGGFSNGFQSVKDAQLLGSVRTGVDGEFIINVDLATVQDISTLEAIAWGRLAFRYRTSYWGDKIWGYELFSTFRRGDFPKPTYEGNDAVYDLADARVDAMKTLKVRFVFIAKNAANQEMVYVKVKATYEGTGDNWKCRGTGGIRTVANNFPFGSHKGFICKHQRGSQIYPVTVGKTSVKYSFKREGYVKIEDILPIEENRAPDHYIENPNLGTVGYYVSQTNLDLSYQTELYTRKCLDTCCSQIEPLQTNDCRSLNLGLRYKASQGSLASSSRSDRGSGAVKQGLTICASNGKINFGGQFPLVLDRTVRGSVVHSAGLSGFTKIYDLPDSWNEVRYQFPGAGCAKSPPNNVFYQIDGGSRQDDVRKYYILLQRRSDVLYIDARGYAPSKEMGMSLLSNGKEKQGAYIDLNGRSVGASKKYFLFFDYQAGAPFRLKIKPVLSTGIYNYLFRGNRAKEIDSAHSAVARESSDRGVNPYVVDLVPMGSGEEALSMHLHNCVNDDFSSNRCDTYPLGRRFIDAVSLAVGYLEDGASTTCSDARYENIPSSSYTHTVQNGVDVLLFNDKVKSFDCISYVSSFTSETQEKFMRSASNRDDFSVGSGRSAITVINLYRNWIKPIEGFTPSIRQTTKKDVTLYSRPTQKDSFRIRKMPQNALLWASFGYLVNGKKWFWVSYSSGDVRNGYVLSEDGLTELVNSKFEFDVYHVASDGTAVNFRDFTQKLASVCFSSLSSPDECSDLSDKNNVIANTATSATTYTFDIADYFAKRKSTADEFFIILEADAKGALSFFRPNIRKRISMIHDSDGNWKFEVSKEKKVFYFETDESFGFDYKSTGVSADDSDIVDATSTDSKAAKGFRIANSTANIGNNYKTFSKSTKIDSLAKGQLVWLLQKKEANNDASSGDVYRGVVYEVMYYKNGAVKTGYVKGSSLETWIDGNETLNVKLTGVGDRDVDIDSPFEDDQVSIRKGGGIRTISVRKPASNFTIDDVEEFFKSGGNTSYSMEVEVNDGYWNDTDETFYIVWSSQSKKWSLKDGNIVSNEIKYVTRPKKALTLVTTFDFEESGNITQGVYKVYNVKTSVTIRKSPGGNRIAQAKKNSRVKVISNKLYKIKASSTKSSFLKSISWAKIRKEGTETNVGYVSRSYLSRVQEGDDVEGSSPKTRTDGNGTLNVKLTGSDLGVAKGFRIANSIANIGNNYKTFSKSTKIDSLAKGQLVWLLKKKEANNDASSGDVYRGVVYEVMYYKNGAVKTGYVKGSSLETWIDGNETLNVKLTGVGDRDVDIDSPFEDDQVSIRKGGGIRTISVRKPASNFTIDDVEEFFKSGGNTSYSMEVEVNDSYWNDTDETFYIVWSSQSKKWSLKSGNITSNEISYTTEPEEALTLGETGQQQPEQKNSQDQKSEITTVVSETEYLPQIGSISRYGHTGYNTNQYHGQDDFNLCQSMSVFMALGITSDQLYGAGSSAFDASGGGNKTTKQSFSRSKLKAYIDKAKKKYGNKKLSVISVTNLIDLAKEVFGLNRIAKKNLCSSWWEGGFVWKGNTNRTILTKRSQYNVNQDCSSQANWNKIKIDLLAKGFRVIASTYLAKGGHIVHLEKIEGSGANMVAIVNDPYGRKGSNGIASIGGYAKGGGGAVARSKKDLDTGGKLGEGVRYPINMCTKGTFSSTSKERRCSAGDGYPTYLFKYVTGVKVE